MLVEEKKKNKEYNDELNRIRKINLEIELENIKLINDLKKTYLNLLEKNVINKKYIKDYEKNISNCNTQEKIKTLYNSLIEKSKTEEIKLDDFKKKRNLFKDGRNVVWVSS